MITKAGNHCHHHSQIKHDVCVAEADQLHNGNHSPATPIVDGTTALLMKVKATVHLKEPEEHATLSNTVARRAVDHTRQYAGRSLNKDVLIKYGRRALLSCIMKPKAGYDYLATTAHFAPKSSNDTNWNACTTDDTTKLS